MCGSSAPTPPDPFAVASAQTKSNLATADSQSALNAVDQYNPYGSDTFLRDQYGDPYAQVSSMTPALSALLGGQEQLGYGMQGTAKDLAGSLPTGGINTDFGSQIGDAEKGAFGAATSLLNPEFALQDQALTTNMTDRGIPVGSEAWNSATQGERLPQEAALGQAASAAIGQGQQEQNTLFGQGVQAHQLPYSDLANVLSMSPTNGILGQAPSAQGTSATTIQPTNTAQITQNAYQQQLNAYNQQQANQTQMLLGGGALALAFSDEDLKENRKKADGEHILASFRDLGVDHYDYKKDAKHHLGVPEHRTGPMAQDYHRVFDGEGSDGHMIDLGDLAGKMLAAIKALDVRTSHLNAKHA